MFSFKHPLGPPFTHPTLPNVAHFIGAITPRSSPAHYLDAAMALIQSYRLDIQTPDVDLADEHESRISDVIPLVVNTMGWSKGLGADLTQRIEDMLEPTDIFDIMGPGSSREQYPITNDNQRSRYAACSKTSMVDESLARLHELQPIVSSSSAAGYTPADHRTLSILSYFHASFPLDIISSLLNQITARFWDTSRPLCAIPPYEVDCTVAIDKVILTGAGSEDVVEEEISVVLNGAIVGMVRCDPGAVDVENNTDCILSTGINYTRYLAPPSPSSSNCVGIALIRGISPLIRNDPPVPTKTYLHLLTPLPHSLLACGRVLVKGEMELPVWGMLDFRSFDGGKGVTFGDVAGVERDKVPFLQWGKTPEGAMGADKRRVRRNLMRRGQM
jgi:polynucleotide 5'-hydroxyl-kinase GRC3/NOL9